MELAEGSAAQAGGTAPSQSAREAVTRALDAFRDERFEDSIRPLSAGAREGDPLIQYALGCLMDAFNQLRTSGEPSLDERDDPRFASITRAIGFARRILPETGLSSLDWLERSAAAGFEPAQWEIARRLDTAPTVPAAEQSARWYERLVSAGHPGAMREMGLMYREGYFRPRDRNEAVRLITRAADAGDGAAMLMLAGMYRDGRAGRRDLAEARAWFGRLAGSGDPHGQYFLARALREGPVRDPVRAAALLLEASNAGLAQATFELSDLYRRGDGVVADPTRAEALRNAAAAQGNCFATLERLEGRIRSGQIESGASEQARRQFDERCGGFQWRVSQDMDAISGDGLSPVELRQWERRRQDARIALGFELFIAGDIAAAFASGDAGRISWAVDRLVAHAEQVEFEYSRAEAIAVLAYPAPWIPRTARDRFDSARWRGVIQVAEPELRGFIGAQILSSPLASRDIEVALSVARSAEGNRAAIERFTVLQGLGLHPVAYEEMLSRLSESGNPELLDQTLQSTAICSYDRMYSDWVAMTAGETSDCGGATALSTLDAGLLTRLADLGSDNAKLFLGMDYLHGRTVQRDIERAASLLESVAERDIALGALGAVFEDGRGVRPDLDRATRYYEAALERFERNTDSVRFPGSAAGAARLGRILLRTSQTPTELRRGAGMLRYAAEFGVALAQTSYGDALWLGRGVTRNRAEALRWYREGTASGDEAALVRFGFLATLGSWRERDLAAKRWFRLAAEADDPLVYIELVQAAASAPAGAVQNADIRRWLRHAAAMENGWGQMWLAACPGAAPLSCLRRQAGFGGIYAALAADRREQGAPEGVPHRPRRGAPQILAADVLALNARVDFQLERGEASDAVIATLSEMERIQVYHGDREGALASRIRRVVIEDNHLQIVHGDLRNYFALVESSCNWGQASRMAHRNGLPNAALLLAKISVNRLQQARASLANLDGDIRECFIAIHEDRYRWLADLFIESGRLVEAEEVLGMLKDFEHANYTRDHARRGSSTALLAFSPSEAAAAARIEAMNVLPGTPRDGGPVPSSTADVDLAQERNLTRIASAEFRTELDQMITTVVALDANAPASRRTARADWLRSIRRSIVADLQRRFGPGTAALHAVVLPDRIHWIISTARGQRSITIPVRPGDLTRRIGDFSVAMRRQDPSVVEAAQALYDLTFAPVDAALRRLGVRNVMLSLDGRLRYLPFAALHDREGWLVQRYNFSSFRRPDDYLRRGSGGGWTMAGFGTSVGHAGLSDLPAVPAELNGIVRTDEQDDGIVPGIVQLDPAFTRQALTGALNSRYRVIHIASHFVLGQRSAADSYLLLGNGERLSLLDFRSDGNLTFANVDLVTLSACRTALEGAYGDGSEVDSMGTIVQDAGAPAVLASLWLVQDRSTAELMLRFYRHRVQGGLTTADALRQAQLDLLNGTAANGAGTASYTHPYHWAPFILIGNTN